MFLHLDTRLMKDWAMDMSVDSKRNLHEIEELRLLQVVHTRPSLYYDEIYITFHCDRMFCWTGWC